MSRVAHAVTSIKHHPRDFSHKQLLVEIERGHQIRELFFVARRVIAQAGLSAESIRFYASLVDYYTAYKLKRMTPAMTRLYLLCCVHNRYQRLNDHLARFRYQCRGDCIIGQLKTTAERLRERLDCHQ